MKTTSISMALMSLLVFALNACSNGDSTEIPANDEGKDVLITTQKVKTGDLPVWLETVGRIRAVSEPALAAEVDGRITMIAADTGDEIREGQVLAQIDTTIGLLQQQAAQAGIERLVVHMTNGERRVGRLEKLSSNNMTSQSQLDDAREQLAAYRADHKAALAELEIIKDSLARSSVVAPLAGIIQQRLVTEGDFVKRGQSLFSITRPQRLQAWLPYAERLALKVRVGQVARIRSPLTPGEFFEGEITDIQPALGAGNRAVMAIVDIDEPGNLRPEATLTGQVLVETRVAAVMVPSISVVRRPAGNVVYVINDNIAHAKVVITGQHLNGHIEITHGLDGSETVAVDGAAFLTDSAMVTIGEHSP